MSKRKTRPARRWRLVLRFAVAALVAFVAVGAGLSVLLSRRALDRDRRAATGDAQFVIESVFIDHLTSKDLSAPVKPDRYSQLLDFARAHVLQPPLVLVTVWRSDGTVLFSSVRALVGKRFDQAPDLRAAFVGGISRSAVVYNLDKGKLFVPTFPEQVLDTFVPVFQQGGKTSAAPVAVAEVYTDYGAIVREAQATFRKDFVMVAEALGLIYLLLLPVAWSLSHTLERQNNRVEVLLSRERSTQFERRRLLDRMLKAAEEERTRLAAELHDGAVQRLARLGFGLERVRSRQKQGDVSGAEHMLREMQAAVFEEVKELRAMMSRLRPPVLDQRGLEDALRDRAEAIRADTGLECTIQAKLSGRLAPSLETVLYRVSQEALQNVVKHARAKHANVVLGRDNGAVVLEVQDDGVGFQPGETKSGSGDHFGMLAMRERVEMIGGTCEVTSSPGQGTRVRVVLPWQGSQA
jgi:signal transduction histidine kinase